MCKKHIGVGTGVATGTMAPHFSAKMFIRIFLFFRKHNLYTENDSPRQGEHTPAYKCIVDGLVVARDEIEVSLAPSLLMTFLRP